MWPDYGKFQVLYPLNYLFALWLIVDLHPWKLFKQNDYKKSGKLMGTLEDFRSLVQSMHEIMSNLFLTSKAGVLNRG